MDGLVVFASFMMILLGTFQAIQGLVAIFDEGFYLVSHSGLVVDVDYNVWGAVHLLLGLLWSLTVSASCPGTWPLARSRVILAALSALANMPSSRPIPSGAS